MWLDTVKLKLHWFDLLYEFVWIHMDLHTAVVLDTRYLLLYDVIRCKR